MRSAHLLLLSILGAALISTALCRPALGPDSCCFGFYDKRIKRDLVKSFFETDPRCNKLAAVFITVKGRRICVNPERPWVKNIISELDQSTF